MATKPDVELVAVTKRYGETLAVDTISLKIPAGSRLGIVGPVGSGKTYVALAVAARPRRLVTVTTTVPEVPGLRESRVGFAVTSKAGMGNPPP